MRFEFKTVIATGISLWLAVLACLMGCTLPNLASAGSVRAFSVGQSSGERDTTDLMAGMESCPHHHYDGSAPARPNGEKPVHGGNMSCCPVEVTVAAKPDIAKLGIALPHGFVLHTSVELMTNWVYHAAESVPSMWHSGRDTLLETHLLRI
jgi:hypothetical protein